MPADHPHVRAGAVSALKYCGDASVPALIRPLAAGHGGPDPHDDIKGNALDLLWPDHITAAELFPLLTPTADNYFGAYALFQMALPDTLKTTDLLPALAWATQLIAQSDHMGGFRGEELGRRHHVQGVASVREPGADAALPRTHCCPAAPPWRPMPGNRP